MTFQYVATNAKGDNIRGTLTVTDRNDLNRKLKEKGLFLVSCRQEADAPVATADKPAPAATAAVAHSYAPSKTGAAPVEEESAPSWFSSLFAPKSDKLDLSKKPKGSVNLKELVILTRQISISINAGMSIVDAIQGIQQFSKNPLMAYTLKHILDDVLSGKKLSEGLAANPDVFKPVFVNMVAAGEAGGFVPQALNRVAEFLEKEMELRSRVRSAMVYPIVIAVVAFTVVIFMMVFIVPIFIQVFKDMNAPLPGPTRALLACSSFVTHGGFMTPFVLLGIFYVAYKYREKNERFHDWWDEKALSLPLFGHLLTLTVITRFIRTLATLVDNGVMALQAISMSRQVVENRTIEKVADEIYNSVQQGNGISVVLYKSKHFPVLVANMVSTGERTGELPTVLIKMAEYYESEVSSAVRDLLTMMEPLLIVIMAVIVGFIIAGLMLPTFQMASLVG